METHVNLTLCNARYNIKCCAYHPATTNDGKLKHNISTLYNIHIELNICVETSTIDMKLQRAKGFKFIK